VGSRRRNSSGCCAGIQGTCPGDSDRDFSRNSAACVHLGGAVFQERRTRVWGPPVGVSGALRRVARATEHGAVADVERRTTSGERHDVIDGQVARRVGAALVARAPVPVLAVPGTEHAGAETLPGPRAVEGVVPAAVGLPSMVSAAATRAAGDDTTDRAELHPRIVGGEDAGVYPLGVLGLRASRHDRGCLRASPSPTVVRRGRTRPYLIAVASSVCPPSHCLSNGADDRAPETVSESPILMRLPSGSARPSAIAT
jgi:hypothetical protein